MQNYIEQKAQQAIEALCEDRPLWRRLQLAKLHFENCEDYLDTAPEDVQQFIKAFLDSFNVPEPKRSKKKARAEKIARTCLALNSAIEAVFEECGREEERRLRAGSVARMLNSSVRDDPVSLQP